MDRLPLVIAARARTRIARAVVASAVAASALVGCDDGSAPIAPSSRVVAVAAEREDPFAQICDATPGRPFVMPPLAEGDAPPAARGERWVNVWATWCRPCVEELPRLVGFGERLRAEGFEAELVFISADRDAESVATFRAAHPATPDSVRFADPAALSAWAVSVGLDEGATLPIHLFVDTQGRVRCARTGGISDRDYEAVRGVFDAM